MEGGTAGGDGDVRAEVEAEDAGLLVLSATAPFTAEGRRGDVVRGWTGSGDSERIGALAGGYDTSASCLNRTAVF